MLRHGGSLELDFFSSSAVDLGSNDNRRKSTAGGLVKCTVTVVRQIARTHPWEAK
jgi:hypothetical protein